MLAKIHTRTGSATYLKQSVGKLAAHKKKVTFRSTCNISPVHSTIDLLVTVPTSGFK